jgi:hypothetical protein
MEILQRPWGRSQNSFLRPGRGLAVERKLFLNASLESFIRIIHYFIFIDGVLLIGDVLYSV